jgi:hypothetical protein
MPLIDKCEVRKGKTWETIGIAEALKRRGEDMRCGECHGQFVPNKKYSTGARPHFGHMIAHAGCATKTTGKSSLHPNPLE